RHFVSPQEAISDLILSINDALANVAIALLGLSVVWLGGVIGTGWRNLYWTLATSLLAKVDQRVGEIPFPAIRLGVRAIVSADLATLVRRLDFAKALGPALRF